MIEIKLDDRRALDVMARLMAAGANAAPAMARVADIMHGAVNKNFAAQGRPLWVGYKYAPSQKRGGGSAKLLRDTGRLIGSIVDHHDGQSATVGVGGNLAYAAIHQFGGQTKPHVIVAKNGKALKLPGGKFRKKVNHPGSKIPARPYLALQGTDWALIGGAVSQFLQKLAQ